MRQFAAVLAGAALTGSAIAFAALASTPAQARIDCHPYCDFVHDYGPSDMGWVRPGLTCYRRCDAYGRCAPTPACTVVNNVAGRGAFETGWLDGRDYVPRPAGRVTVRPRQPR